MNRHLPTGFSPHELALLETWVACGIFGMADEVKTQPRLRGPKMFLLRIVGENDTCKSFSERKFTTMNIEELRT